MSIQIRTEEHSLNIAPQEGETLLELLRAARQPLREEVAPMMRAMSRATLGFSAMQTIIFWNSALR